MNVLVIFTLALGQSYKVSLFNMLFILASIEFWKQNLEGVSGEQNSFLHNSWTSLF